MVDRKLQVKRISLHKNFFFSLLFHSLMQIVWEAVFIREILVNPTALNNDKHNVNKPFLIGVVSFDKSSFFLLLLVLDSLRFYWNLFALFAQYQLLLDVLREFLFTSTVGHRFQWRGQLENLLLHWLGHTLLANFAVYYMECHCANERVSFLWVELGN